MNIFLTTTGSQSSVTIADLAGSTFEHPTVNLNLGNEFDFEDVELSILSGQLGAAITAGTITLTDGAGNSIVAGQSIDSGIFLDNLEDVNVPGTQAEATALIWDGTAEAYVPLDNTQFNFSNYAILNEYDSARSLYHHQLGSSSNLFLGRSNGSLGSPTAVFSFDTIGRLGFLANNSSASIPDTIAASIDAIATESHSPTARGTELAFRVTDEGTTQLANAVRILPNADVVAAFYNNGRDDGANTADVGKALYTTASGLLQLGVPGIRHISVYSDDLDSTTNYNLTNEPTIILTGTEVNNSEGDFSYNSGNGFFTTNFDGFILVFYDFGWIAGLGTNASRNHIRNRIILNNGVTTTFHAYSYTYIRDVNNHNREGCTGIAIMQVSSGTTFRVVSDRAGTNSAPCNLFGSSSNTAFNNISALRLL